jgi:hypothetical protein
VIDRYVFSDPPTMRELAELVDTVINSGPGERMEGFLLIRFRHGEVNKPRYITSCPAEQTKYLLRLLLAQLEGRITGEEGNV